MSEPLEKVKSPLEVNTSLTDTLSTDPIKLGLPCKNKVVPLTNVSSSEKTPLEDLKGRPCELRAGLHLRGEH